MRSFIILIFLLIPAHLAAAATVEKEPSREYSKLLDKENVEFLRNLAILLEGQGFKDVRIIPQLFVAIAKNSEGRPKTLMVDYNTLKAFSFDGELPLVSTVKDGQPETAVPSLH
jgi:hypothetical protein